MTYTCDTCGRPFERKPGQANRTGSGRHFCALACAGAFRRVGAAALKERKRLYDAEYRATNLARITAAKAAHYAATKDREKERAIRKKNRERHRAYIAAYNADPANKAAKRAYDAALRASAYGDFAECSRLLLDLERLIRQRCPDKYERQKARGYFERVNAKKREQRRIHA